MSEEPKFKCDRCGLCCRKLKGSPLAMFDRGDGVCRYLNKDNLCSIYENRPLICNVDKLYDKKYSGRITREVYHLTVTKIENGKNLTSRIIKEIDICAPCFSKMMGEKK